MIFEKIKDCSKTGEFWMLLSIEKITLKYEIPYRELKFVKVSSENYFDIKGWEFNRTVLEEVPEQIINSFKLGDIYDYAGKYFCDLDINHGCLEKREVILSNYKNLKFRSNNDFFNNTPLESHIKNTSYYLYNDSVYIPLNLIYQFFYYFSSKTINIITNYEKLNNGFINRDFENSNFTFDNALGIGQAEAKFIGKYWFTNADEQKTGLHSLKKAINNFYNLLRSQREKERALVGEIFYNIPFNFPIKATVLGQKISTNKFYSYRLFNVEPYKKDYTFFANLEEIEPIALVDTRSAKKKEDNPESYIANVTIDNIKVLELSSDSISVESNPNYGTEEIYVQNDIFTVSPRYKITKKVINNKNYEKNGIIVNSVEEHGVLTSHTSSGSNTQAIDYIVVKESSSEVFFKIIEYLKGKGVTINFATINDSEDLRFSYCPLENSRIPYLIIVIAKFKNQEYFLIETGVNRNIGVIKNLSKVPVKLKNDRILSRLIRALDHKNVKFSWSSLFYDGTPSKNYQNKKKRFDYMKEVLMLEVLQPINHRYRLSENETIQKVGDKIYSRINK